MYRNPFVSIRDEPIEKADLENLRSELNQLWEDTRLSTEPNNYFVISAGNLRAIVDTLLMHMRNDMESPHKHALNALQESQPTDVLNV